MLQIDGSEGGGQLLRTAIVLATLTGTPVRIESVRGAREQPGLKVQHATAVRAAAAITNAHTEGVEVGSRTVEFDPDGVQGGQYSVDVGTAGSLTLLFETVLPLALAAERPVTLRATGGTDVTWSPSFDYLRRVKLPLVRRFGLGAAVELERRGFFPAGGGAATLTLFPSHLRQFDLGEPVGQEALTGVRVYAAAAEELSGADVAERLATTAVEVLEEAGQMVSERVVEYTTTRTPGAVLTLRADTTRTLDTTQNRDTTDRARGDTDVDPIRPVGGVSALGERGKPAEAVAEEALEQFEEFRDAQGAVDRHLADQLVLPLAVAGGTVVIPDITAHVASSVDLVRKFGLEIEVEESSGGGALLSAPGTDL